MRSNTVDFNLSKESLQEARWVFPTGASLQRFLLGASESVAPELLGSEEVVLTGQRLLAGCGDEFICTGFPRQHRQTGPLHIFESNGIATGFVRLPADTANLEERSLEAYRAILSLPGDYGFCRFWNFVPNINLEAEGYLENYKLFCLGRAHAFNEVLGSDSFPQFPSASATGSSDDHLTVVFLASRGPVRNWENPEQTPAYRYPETYGPEPPSFARASLFADPDGGEWVFISGTAAIKGYESQCPDDFLGQLEVTLDNINLTLQQVDLSLKSFDADRRRHFKVFLRDARKLETLLNRIDDIVGDHDTITVVQGDICRRELDVEIELTVAPPGVTAD